MALILHLETATKVCSVSLSESGRCLVTREDGGESFGHGEHLTLFIEAVMQEACRDLKELDAISVSAGPGSYTGLRIGVATAKGLCYALSIPLIAIDSLSSLAALVRKRYPDSVLCPMIDARRMEVYTALFLPNAQPLYKTDAVVIEENTFVEFEPFYYFGDGSTKLSELWKYRRATILHGINASASGQCERAYTMYKEREFVDLAYWEPVYLKDFVMGK